MIQDKYFYINWLKKQIETHKEAIKEMEFCLEKCPEDIWIHTPFIGVRMPEELRQVALESLKKQLKIYQEEFDKV